MRRRNQNGFSLMDLMIVIAIIGITSAIAVPNMISWRAGHKLRGVSNNFMANLQMARLQAIRESGSVAVLITANGYSVFIDDGAGGGAANDFNLDLPGERELRNVTLPAGVTISNNPFNNSRTRFDSRGMVGLPSSGTLVFQNDTGDMRSVVLNEVGRVRVQ